MPTTPALHIIAEEIGHQKSLIDITFRAAGAFKETYRTINIEGEFVALKVLNPEKCSIERTEREVDAMKRCNSRFIGRLYDYGVYRRLSDGKDYHFVIEEFFDGGTLSDRLAQSGSLSVETVRAYGVSLTQALAETHSLNLVHRDIKPDNIMFRSTADEPVLVDFGLVRNLSESSLTMTWLPNGPGTPLFASPEQLNNQKPLIDWRSDEFSLGIVLGICLTGRHPFSDGRSLLPDIVAGVGQRRKCSSVFRDEADKAGFPNIVKMIEPWSVRRFLTPADLLASF